jgi:hypothetical protein
MGSNDEAERREQAQDGAEVRCTCGALVAREKDGWVEVRCRRCKQGIRLSWQGGRLVVQAASGRGGR